MESNNTILITGGSSGIGLALAQQLSTIGNRVIICGRSQEALNKTKATHPDLIIFRCDIANAESRRDLCDWLEAEHPLLNILINNAGVQFNRNVQDSNAFDGIDEEIGINFTAQVHMIGDLLPLLRQQFHAIIVNVTSGLAFSPMADIPIYCATKAAMHSFTLSLRHQLRNTNIKVTELAPPMIDTSLGNGTRSSGTKGQTMMLPDAFAKEAIAQLIHGKDEILIGSSAGLREKGESLFERMNSH